MRSALVTGASSGIGRACARALHERGFAVWAGVRHEADAEAVAAEGMSALELDVTDADAVSTAAAKFVEATGGHLDVLVNNAGIAVPDPVEVLSDADLRRQFDVNLFGLHRVTRTLLPAVLSAQGRIVQVGSSSGRTAMPFLGAYVASKFALEGYSEALRREIAPLGAHVVVIQAGQVATPIWGKSIPTQQRLQQMPAHYRDAVAGLAAVVRRSGPGGISPERVAATVSKAATARRPRTRYGVPWQECLIVEMLSLLPGRVVDILVRREIEQAR